MNDYQSIFKSLNSNKTILHILKERVKENPDKVIYKFLTFLKSERYEKDLTFSMLDKEARKVAAYLQRNKMEGKRVILLYPDGLDFIIGLFGCLYAKAIAVPLYHFVSDRKINRLLSVIYDSEADFFLTDSKNIARLRGVTNKYLEKETIWVATDEICDIFYQDFHELNYEKIELAYLQYTSGSTSLPKGVMITHENIMHNMDVIHWHFNNSEKSVGVSWIPHYHDMGLIYAIFQPIYLGYQQILMLPSDFISKPFRFFKAISDFRGTTFAMPNFAYDYSAKVITEELKQELDLSSVQNAVNGAEPIYLQTIDSFYNYFKSCGLKKDAMAPGYGLAEATLVVSVNKHNKDGTRVTSINVNRDLFEKNIIQLDNSQNAINCCSSGIVKEDVKIKIVNADTLQECKEGMIGEIWISSKSVSPGYWNKLELNEQIFQAFTSDTHEGAFLRTGDLGFFYEDNLYISGRRKDVIIIRGSNYYPNDIEYVVSQAHVGLNANSCAAFTIIENNSEQLYVATELIRDTDQIKNPKEISIAIRKSISEVHGLQTKGIVLLAFGSIPKTSSGKIQRALCKEKFIKNNLKIIFTDIQQI